MAYLTSQLNNLTDTTDTTDIGKAYDNSLAAKLSSIDTDTQQAVAEQQKTIDDSKYTYQPLKNQAYAENLANQRTLRENMANMGMSGGGGKSLTLENKLASSQQNTLAGIALQQQQLIDNAKTQIAQLQASGETAKASATAELTLQKIQALADEAWKQKQLNQTAEQGDMQTYMNLYLNGRITAAQFKALTGINA